MSDERRSAARFNVWFPMRLQDGDAGQALAVSQNVSHSGVLMVTSRKLEEGATVTARFRVPPDNHDHTFQGRVLRVESNGNDPEGLWPYRVAVVFDELHPDLEPLLVASVERQSRPPE